MRNTLITAATVALTLAVATTATFAANPAFCANYAHKALKAEAINLNEAGHYAWCLGVTKGQANSESWARKASIIDCESDY